MNDIAAAAGVARATVYRYFPNRQALFDELALAAVNDADAGLASARIDEVAPEEGVVRAVRALVDVGDSFVLLARQRVRIRPRAFRSQGHPAAARAVRARSGRRRHPRRHHQRSPDRVAHRTDRRRAHVQRRPRARKTRSPRSPASSSTEPVLAAHDHERPIARRRVDAHGPTPEPRRSRWTKSPIERLQTRNRISETRRPAGGALRRRPSPLLQELVAYLRDNRTELSEEWARRISEAELLGVMSDEEIFSEATEVYDNYVDALETGSIETLQTYAHELSERIIPRGVETHEVLGIVLLLRDVLARSLFTKYQEDLELLNRILDAYEPAANRIAVTVGVSFVEERERVINEQQESLRELSTPVLQLRDRLLILPIIGVLDSARARQLTEQLLGAIQENRAKVVVIDITGRRDDRSHRGQPPRPDRRGIAAHGREHDPHRPVVGDRPDARRPRRRPRHDEDGRRPSGRARGGRATGRLSATPTPTPPATTSRPRPTRQMSVAILRQGDYLIASIQSDLSDSEVVELRDELAGAGGEASRTRDRDRRRRSRRDRLLRRPRAALDRPHREVARRRDRDRRASSRTWRSRWCSSA